MDELVNERLGEMAEQLAAVARLAQEQDVRLNRMEGDVQHMRSLAKGMQERIIAIEVRETGSEEGSFAWALTMLRHGVAMRRAAWRDASRVEQFDWHRYLDGAPDEDLLATDWRKAY